MSNKNISVLIVDDNPGFVKRMKVLLGEVDCVDSIHSAGDFDEALWQLDLNKHDTVLLDIKIIFLTVWNMVKGEKSAY